MSSPYEQIYNRLKGHYKLFPYPEDPLCPYDEDTELFLGWEVQDLLTSSRFCKYIRLCVKDEDRPIIYLKSDKVTQECIDKLEDMKTKFITYEALGVDGDVIDTPQLMGEIHDILMQFNSCKCSEDVILTIENCWVVKWIIK